MNWMYLSLRGGSRKRLLTRGKPKHQGLDIAAIRLFETVPEPKSPDPPYKLDISTKRLFEAELEPKSAEDSFMFDSFTPIRSPVERLDTEVFIKESPADWDWRSAEWSSQVSRDSWGCPEKLPGDEWL